MGLLRNEESSEFCDQVFESEIHQCIKNTRENYNKLMYRDAFYSGFIKLQVSNVLTTNI